MPQILPVIVRVCANANSWQSINLECALNFMDFFAVACALQPVGSLAKHTQNDKGLFVIPICLVMLAYLVILSVAKYP